MSTFGGKIEEIPDISVDRFDKDNYQSQAYFLSHCHTDHMVGLHSNNFQDMLLQKEKFIYTSDVSSVILKKMYPIIQNNIKILDMYKPTMIMLRNKIITVTPLPAGHCPGSVMFLFESDRLVLYTGDYRIHKDDIRKLKLFYDSMNKVRAIDKIYLDTTFFLKSYVTFPKRTDSLNELCKIIKEWTDKGNNYVVQLITSAKYGYEYVFNELYKKIGMPVHVHRDTYRLYSIIPEMDNSVTVEGQTTQIHCNCGSLYQRICFESCDREIRSIKVSAFRWTQDNLEGGLSTLISDVYYVCYSTHASYEEGVELIKFLKPKSVTPCVKHDDPYMNLEMTQLIEECLQEFQEEEIMHDGPKLFDTNSCPVQKDDFDNDAGSFKDDFGILNSPPKESVEDLRKFLKQHSQSFSLSRKSEESIQTEFNFDEEFGIKEPRSSKSTEKIEFDVETKAARTMSTLVNDNSCSTSTVEGKCALAVSTELDTRAMIKESSDKLQSEVDPFSKWLLGTPPESTVDLEESEPEAEEILATISKYEEKQSELDEKKTDTHESEESDLLKEIFFLKSSPPHDNKTEREHKEEEIKTNWVLDLFPENKMQEKNMLSKEGEYKKGCYQTNEMCESEKVYLFSILLDSSDYKPEKTIEHSPSRRTERNDKMYSNKGKKESPPRKRPK